MIKAFTQLPDLNNYVQFIIIKPLHNTSISITVFTRMHIISPTPSGAVCLNNLAAVLKIKCGSNDLEVSIVSLSAKAV